MKKIILAFLLLNTIIVESQSYLGNITSNYAGAIGNQLNPSSFVDGRVKFDLTLPAVNLFTYQNFGYFDANAMRTEQGNGGYWWAKSFGDTAILNSWVYPSSTFLDRFIVRNYTSETTKTLALKELSQCHIYQQ
ncbi:MAG: hypothetical protein RLZZ107_1000, partial [Bacteroidota bacterium]